MTEEQTDEEQIDEEPDQSDRNERYADVDISHLDGVEDGCGCAEVWEHTSSEREKAEADAD